MIFNFTKEEVKETVWQCDDSKSPGPDEFNYNFINNCWDTLKHDFMVVVQFFQETRCFSKGCNASFITLVPKVRDHTNLDQYKPISLVGAMCKIITNVLSCGINIVLPTVVDESQLAFLKDKRMLDSVLVANEELQKCGRSGLGLKVDFEKAYDSVRWDFLLDML